ncbi:MAG: putative Phage excisionase [Microbacteriaceae bacterium]|nr:putative Phage excisionase [Microbacteriaceae bacterium]
MPTYDSPTLAAQPNAVARISATSRGFVLTTLAVTTAAFAGAFTTSSVSQLWVAQQIGIPEFARAGVVLGIDAPLLAFSLGAIARRSRGESVASSWIWLTIFSLASVILNAWHGISVAHSAPGTLVFVVLVSSLMPLAVLGTSEQVVGILVAPPSGTRQQRQALARVADRGALPAQTQSAPKPKRGTPLDVDLRETAKALAQAEPGISKAEIAKRTGLSAIAVREALNS